ncbi:hypothetical protein CEXT_664001 [Caerostris extrusa]|uniref:Uncharacterized protein n=1 Tax=Caerostris extrusa TaxID=172846 RepID=A0AAV4RUE7_CAEEX|nr:hypothetical protein CEXT_664001 [Caerostris extrusa]
MYGALVFGRPFIIEGQERDLPRNNAPHMQSSPPDQSSLVFQELRKYIMLYIRKFRGKQSFVNNMPDPNSCRALLFNIM